MWHRHKWSDWLVTERGKLIDGVMPQWKTHVGSYLTQTRYCHTCGKTELNTQKTTLKSDVVLVPDTVIASPKHDLTGSVKSS